MKACDLVTSFCALLITGLLHFAGPARIGFRLLAPDLSLAKEELGDEKFSHDTKEMTISHFQGIPDGNKST